MKLGMVRGVLALAVAAWALLLPLEMLGEVKKLVTKENIFASSTLDDLVAGNLLDDENVWNKKNFHTPDDKRGADPFEGEQYLEVKLDSPLSLGTDEDLIVFVQRCHDCVVRQPTAFRVEGQMADSVTWEPICNLYFLYRGRSTKEYSARFRPAKPYKKLRFYVTENNSRNHDDAGHATMGLRQFQVYQLGRTEIVGDRIDPVHLKSDYKTDYKDYKFEHTKGWLDDRNRSYPNTKENKPGFYNGDINNEAHSKGELDWQQKYIKNINDWAEWDDDWDTEGKWVPDTTELRKFKVTMPDMGLITKDSDFEATTEDPCRQATHVSEHILYAVPGDPIILYPYYKFAAPKHYERYEVNFAHWYDYRKGGRIIHDDGNGNKMDLLDFIVDPSNICITEKNGFYGGYLLTENGDKEPGLGSQNYGMFGTFYCPRSTEIYDNLTLPFRECDKADKNTVNDENEFVIAADFSQSFNKGRNIDGNKIIEPTIAFRHLFRIRDGKKFAEEISESAEANEKYIEKNSRQVTARAGEEFQIGLDGGIPVPNKYETGSDTWWRCAPSKYYYKVSDNDYRRIPCMAIRVISPEGDTITYRHTNVSPEDPYNTDHTFYFDHELFYEWPGYIRPEFTGLGSREIDGVYYGVGGGSVVKGEDRTYSRLLKTKKTDLKGKYTVQLLGEEIIGEGEPRLIKVKDKNNESHDLVVMEYVIDFVDYI